MKKSDLFQLLHGLKLVSKYPGAKFAYGVAKNMKIVSDECAILSKCLEQSPKFQEYEKKREELAIRFSDKDENGKPVIEGNTYVLSSKGQDKFNKALAVVNKEYQDILEDRKKQIDEYSALLEEESDVELFNIASESLPAEITGAEVAIIMEVVDI